MGTFTLSVINVKILPNARVVEKAVYLECVSSLSSSCLDR